MKNFRTASGGSRKEVNGREDIDLLKGLLFTHNPFPMWVYDLETLRFMEVNEAAIAIYGYSRAEFLAMTIRDIRPEEDVPLLLEELGNIRPLLQFSGEWRHRYKTGEMHTVEIASHVFEEGQHKRILVVANDITKRKDAEREQTKIHEELESLVRQRTGELRDMNFELIEEVKKLKDAENRILHLNRTLEGKVRELEEANLEIETFGYSVSHDLRAPLRAIHGYAGVLAEELPIELDGEARQMLQAIQSNASHMGQLIDDLLSFASMGKRPVSKKSIDMNEVAGRALEVLRKTLPPFYARIEIPPLLPAYADFNLMEVVLNNLLSNAIKFSCLHEAPFIEMGSFRGQEGEVVYFIKDNGVGFDMKYYNKLFGVFQRLHGKSQFEGTGIGLVLAKRILTRHGGRIWGESELEKGATFYFSLPDS
jgi:PAS domain S-box-containing protein